MTDTPDSAPVLYKNPHPARDARTPIKTATRNIRHVAAKLGQGSSLRGLHEWATRDPKNESAFWTQLYAKTIEKGPDVQVQVNVGAQTWQFGDKKVDF